MNPPVQKAETFFLDAAEPGKFSGIANHSTVHDRNSSAPQG